MTLWTASTTGRSMSCAASVALPQAPDVPSDAAITGTNIHSFLELALSPHGGRDVAIEKMGSKWAGKARAERIDVDAIKRVIGEGALLEQGMVYNHVGDTAATLGDIYPDEYVCGTADVVSPTAVWDYKTGRDPTLQEALPQLKMLALMTQRKWGAEQIQIGIIALPQSGDAYTETTALTEMELDIFAGEVRGAIKRIEQAHEAVASGRLPVVNPSPDNCRYCRAICPSKMEAR